MSYSRLRFGKGAEYKIIGQMLMEGLDCYLPAADDHGVDCVIRKDDGTFIEIQIKATNKNIAFGNAGLFAAIRHKKQENYYFVFYAERLDTMWVMSSEEFLKMSSENIQGKHVGERTISFVGCRKNPLTSVREEYCKSEFNHFITKDFGRFH